MTDAPAAATTAPTIRPNGRLAAWGRPARGLTLLAGLAGAAKSGAWAGFAWGAAGAAAALAAGDAPDGHLLLAAGGAALRALLQAAEIRLGHAAAARVIAGVRLHAARGLARLGPAFSEQRESGAIAAALTDGAEALRGYYARYLPLQISVVLGPLALLAAALAVSPPAALILLVSGAALALAMAAAGAGAAQAGRDRMAELQRLAGRFGDRLRALPVINAFNAAEREAQGLAAAAGALREKTMAVLRVAFLSSAVLELFSAFAIAAVAVYAGLSLLGAAPFGTGETLDLRLALFLLLLAPEAFAPLRQFSAAYHDAASAQAAAGALAELVGDDREARTPSPPGVGEKAKSAAWPSLAKVNRQISQEGGIPPHPENQGLGLRQDRDFRPSPARGEGIRKAPARKVRAPSVSFENATCVYPGGRTGLKDFSFTAQAGAITALWGPSGCGKSTALKLLAGFAPLSTGRILVDRAPMTAPPRAAWIGQRPRLFHGTLAENIALFDPAISEKAIHAAAEQAGVIAFAAALPQGLETPVGDRGHGLSGGQAQRVALARALAFDAKLLLLDEPTAHLDAETETAFLTALKSAARRRTVILATHSPAARALAKHVVDMGTGQ